jgi:hypothetical protein
MELKLWLDQFSRLHAKARAGKLSQSEQVSYLERRDELARALVAAQRLSVLPGQTPRQALRVARALQIDLELPGGRVRAMTQNISSGGFAALLGQLPNEAESIGFSLKQPGAPEPILGRCRVRDIQKRAGNHLVSFAFEALSPEAQERIEMTLFDAVMEQFEGVAPPPPTKK